jgi:hypothetical protein
MLRVLKVPQDSPYLSAKELKNYEVNMLLSKYESRVSRQTSIGKQRKRLSKPDSMMSSSSSFQSSMSSDLTDVLLGVNEEMKALELSKSPGTEDDLSSICGSEIEDTTTDQELFEGDFDDVLCPICLLELVEGEDVVICINCENELHQHCMDIWANELQRREEETWCPLCRASWNQGKSSTTPAQKLKYVCHISYTCICMLIHFHNALCLVLHRKKITICKSLDVPCTPKPPNIGHPGDCISAAD